MIEYFVKWWNQRRNVREERGFIRQWYLLLGRTGRDATISPLPGNLRSLFPPKDRMWADPFVWKYQGETHIFCEEWIYGESHAHLSVLRLNEHDELQGEATPVLKEPYHLSYPYLFEYDGRLCMVPESGAACTVALYCCEMFPHVWKRAATLMKDVNAADPTLFFHEGKWWMFITIKRGGSRLNHDLFLFSADSPISDHWKPHPLNPVVRGFRRARPAGRPFVVDGKLYRPSQDSLVRYGHRLNINQIVELDGRRYREILIHTVEPGWDSLNRGVHHIDWNDGLLVMDGQRLLSYNEVLT